MATASIKINSTSAAVERLFSAAVQVLTLHSCR